MNDVNQVRVILQQPAVVLNQSEIPIQQVAEAAITASYALTTENVLFSNASISSSFAQQAASTLTALSASYAELAANALNAISASFASFATSASFSEFANLSDVATSASTSQFANSSTFASIASSSQFASTASFANTAGTAANALVATTAFSASAALTSSFVNPSGLPAGTVSSSQQINTGSFSGSITQAENAELAQLAISASTSLLSLFANSATSSSYSSVTDYARLALSASYANTSSFVLNNGQLENTWYVTQEGNDNNDGLTIETAFRTVKRASLSVIAYVSASASVSPIPRRSTIRVSPGYYIEEAPIILPNFTSIVGNDLRTAVVRPTNLTRKENLFLMNNACYAYGLRLEGAEIDNLYNPRTGFFFAFQTGAYIVTSPYIQNCTAAHVPFDKFYVPLDAIPETQSIQPNSVVGNGPGGMIVDDSVLDPYSPLKSMVVDAYTQVAFNGVGLCVRGAGYAQQVSFFTNFSHVGTWAIGGGHASLLNSNTTFGDYGLRSSGKRILVVPDVSTISTHSSAVDSSIILSQKNNIINYVVNKLQLSGSYSASYIDTGSHIYAATRKDSGILIDSITSDLLGEKPGRTAQFTQGLFKGQDISTGSIYTLPTASGFDTAPIAAFRIDDIFRYNQTKCRRDVGYIIDALATDMLYGGNERSIQAGTFYYLYPSIATTTQLQKTLEGLGYATNKTKQLLTVGTYQYNSVSTGSDLILDIVENGTGSLPTLVSNISGNIKITNLTPISNVLTATSTEINAISSSIAIVRNIVKNGTGSLPYAIPYTTMSTDPVVISTYNALKNNITFIQEETIAYLSASWGDFNYDSVKCKRDIGYIISGAAEDLLHGSNSASVASGYYYYLYPSQATTTQLDPTLDGIKYASELSQKIIVNQTFTTASSDVINSYNIIKQNKSAIQDQTIESLNTALMFDFIRAWRYIKEYIVNDPASVFGALSFLTKQKVTELVDIPIDTITKTVFELSPELLQVFGSLITSTSHDFSYAGAGTNFLALPANQGGIGFTDFDIRVFQEDDGRVFHTSGDETGDFYAGNDFVIRQETGTIEGRTFIKAILATFTPLNLALENL